MTRRPWAGSTRRARLPGDWNTRIRPAVLHRDGWRCQIPDYPHLCLGVAGEVDHIRPGDDHSLSNLRAACAPCNARRNIDTRRAPRTRHAPRHPSATRR